MGRYTMPKFNESSYTSLHHFTKSEIDEGWMLGVNAFNRQKDFITNKPIPVYGTMFIHFDKTHQSPTICVDINTYLTAIRNKKRCADYITKFGEIGLPLDICFDGEFSTYRLGK